METGEIVIYAALAAFFIFGGLGSWIATQKYRSPVEGAMLGILLGPFGVLIEALLPNGPKPDNNRKPRRP